MSKVGVNGAIWKHTHKKAQRRNGVISDFGFWSLSLTLNISVNFLPNIKIRNNFEICSSWGFWNCLCTVPKTDFFSPFILKQIRPFSFGSKEKPPNPTKKFGMALWNFLDFFCRLPYNNDELNHEQSTEVIWSLLELFFGWQMSSLLVALDQTSSNSWTKIWREIIFAAVDVAAVDVGCDGVDLLASRLTASRSRSGKVNAGHTGVLSHGERGIRFRNIDVETLWSTWVQTASFLRKACGADVVIQELAKLHYHGAHPFVRIISLWKCPSNHTNIGQIITRSGSSWTEILGIFWGCQATEGNVCSAPTG